jgi:hypothetical protein
MVERGRVTAQRESKIMEVRAAVRASHLMCYQGSNVTIRPKVYNGSTYKTSNI